jgi:hypothetical protein
VKTKTNLFKEHQMTKWLEYVMLRIAIEAHFVMRQQVIWQHCKDSETRQNLLTLSNEARKTALKSITDQPKHAE